MTFGDGFLLVGMLGLAALLVQGLRADRAAGRRQVRRDVPVGRLWIGAILFGGFALLLLAFGLSEPSTPGTFVVESGRLRGAVIQWRPARGPPRSCSSGFQPRGASR